LNTPSLTDLESLARQAGALLRAGFGRADQTHYKSEIDVVTDTDRLAEEFLIREIKGRFAEHSIVAEESGETPGKDCCVWYIDPMDGTVNFAHGLPHFGVSIGYAADGVMRFGVVYDPMRAECFSAERGVGAWLNGAAIRASGALDLNTSLLATEFGYDIRSHPQNNLDQYAYFTLHTQGVRRTGSAALDLCYAACGRFDGYWELRLKPWDVAAGGLIAEQAGARVTKIDGGGDYVTPPCSILAAAPGIHRQMLEVIVSFQ
jgi:myo-inositol-1(or 4)-monophosphatase